MLTYPSLDPVIFSVGPLAIRWYGMMYLVGFLAAFWLGRIRTRQSWSPLQVDQVEDLIFYGALGAVLGGRCGYVFFYGFERFLADPIWLFRVWEGGMSFHGGLLGVLVALWLYAKKVDKPLAAVCDFVAPLAPVGLGLGRLANFINAELYGRQTDVSWSMVFPTDPLALPRHPSQLYQFALEGILLFLLLWFFSNKRRSQWQVTGLFLVGYGASRIFVEFFREPDASLAFEWITRGQLLSMPMIALGLIMLASPFFGRAEMVDRKETLGRKQSNQPSERSKRYRSGGKNMNNRKKRR